MSDINSRGTDPHQRLALEQAAMHTTRLGVARWSSGNSMSELDLAAALMPSAQVDWYAQAQAGFVAWLHQGGFSSVEAAEPVDTPTAALAPKSTALAAGAPLVAQAAGPTAMVVSG